GGSVTVTAPQACSWTATTATPWITFSGPTSGTGNGTVNFNLTANASTTQRTGFVTASRNNVAVSQKGSATYVSTLNPVFQSGASGTVTFNLTDPLGTADFQYARFYFGNNQVCEIDAAPGGNNIFLFVYNSTTGDFSPSMAPGLSGQPQSITNGNCTVF